MSKLAAVPDQPGKQNLLDENVPPEAILEAVVIVLREYNGLLDHIGNTETPYADMSTQDKNGILVLYNELCELKRKDDMHRPFVPTPQIRSA